MPAWSVMSQVAFPGVDDAELVIGVEVVIEPHVELIPVGVGSVSIGLVADH